MMYHTERCPHRLVSHDTILTAFCLSHYLSQDIPPVQTMSAFYIGC